MGFVGLRSAGPDDGGGSAVTVIVVKMTVMTVIGTPQGDTL
jgi:hypothetical protein